MEIKEIEDKEINLDKKQYIVTVIYGLIILCFMIIGCVQEGGFGVVFFIFQLLYALVIIIGIEDNNIILKGVGVLGAVVRLLLYFPVLIMFLMPGFLFYDTGVYTPLIWKKLLIFDVSVITPLYCIFYIVYYIKLIKLRNKKAEIDNSNEEQK